MVDWSKISAGLADRIRDIITSEGESRETAELNKHAEYQKLSALLSGDCKVSGKEKGFVEGMLKDYQEAYMVRQEVRERVLDIIKHGEKMSADDNAEKDALKNYAKTKGLTKEEKKWIKDVIDGRVIKEVKPEATERAENNVVNVNKESVENTEKKADNAEKNKIDSEEKTPKKETETNVNSDKEKRENNSETKPEKYPNTVPDKGVYPPSQEPPTFGPAIPVVPVVPPVGDNDVKDDKDHFDDKDGIDNKGALQQGGVGNINVGPGSNVVINNGIPVEINPTNPGFGEETTAPVDKDKNTDDAKQTDKPSVEEAKEARDNGKIVADALLGHTSNTEQRTVQDIVNEEVNSGNVLEFLKGYEKGLKDDMGVKIGPALGGTIPGAIDIVRSRDHFFEQMRTENNFPEQQDLMRKVAEDLQVYLANKYGVDSDIAREVAIILLEQTLDKEQTETLDKIYQKELGTQNETRHNSFPNPITSAAGLGAEIIRKLNE